MSKRAAEPGTVHMICGATGAGKTTYATALAQKLPALCLTLDEWMGRLYWPDAVPGESEEWEMVRIDRCLSQMRSVMLQVIPLGVSAVVDAQFTTRRERESFGGWAEEQGWQVTLRWIDAEFDTRWARILSRNAQGGGGTGIIVTRPMFERVEEAWQPPEADEMARWWGRRVVVEE